MEEYKDGKEDLLNELLVGILPMTQNPDAVKNYVYMVVSKYQITERTTALAILDEGFNQELIKKFLIAKKVKGCTDRTLKYYGTELPRYLSDIGKNVNEITTDDLRVYIARREMSGIKKTSAHNIYRVLSSFFGWLYKEEYIRTNPVSRLDMKHPKVHKEAFSEMDVEKIRCACETSRDTAIVELLLSTGCRVGEIVRIMICDIEGDSLIVHGKGEKDRRVYLNARAIIALDRYIKERNDNNPYLFPKMLSVEHGKKAGVKQEEMKNWFKDPDMIAATEHCTTSSIEMTTRRIGKKAGVKPCNPHRFRHTFATMASKRGMPITTISNMLGHENVATTQIYLDIDDNEISAAHRKYMN